jgi:sulfoxide reductase heme-binding subunit YedZ
MKPTRGQIFTSILCLLPISLLGIYFFSDQLTANPIQALTLQTGRISIYLLLLTLICSPIRNLTQLSALMPIRKTLGLFSFFYALSHFLVFIILDYQLHWEWIQQEIGSKPFLQIGLLAVTILFFLAVTSFRNIQKNLGKKWSVIHKLVYPATGLVIIHIFLTAKGDYSFPIQLSILFSTLMILRLLPFKNKQAQRLPSFLRDLNKCLLGHPKWVK